MGEAIIRARQSPTKRKSSKRKVPDEAIDSCEQAYEAADGNKKKATMGNTHYDDYGWMLLVCRHDIPLFFANIDTLGEQQKYMIALILWFVKHIPKSSTASILYDVTCIVDRSVQKVQVLLQCKNYKWC